MTFVLSLRLKTQKFQEDELEKRLEIGRLIYNSCLAELYKRYNTMRQSKEYQRVIRMDKGAERNKLLGELCYQYKLKEYDLYTHARDICRKFNKSMDSTTAQKISETVFKNFKGVLFNKSKKASFKKKGEMITIENKTSKSGLRYKEGYLMWNKLKIPVIINKNDIYAQEALCNKIKYSRITKKVIRGKTVFYIQIILDKVPPVKKNKADGKPKVPKKIGRVGIDIGTQTVAIVSKETVKLLELAPSVENVEREKRVLKRKLDRQKRVSNPDKYDEKGRCISNKKSWHYSKNYNKNLMLLKELERKLASKRKHDHYKLANWVLGLGHKVYVEKMDFEKIKKSGFGRSIGNKAPSMFLTLLDNKLKWRGKALHKINTYKIKASQYNHIEDSYKKKSLGERWNQIGKHSIQRDLYSAFLIMCTMDDLQQTDKGLCKRSFPKFRKLHDIEIERIRGCGVKAITSMGVGE